MRKRIVSHISILCLVGMILAAIGMFLKLEFASSVKYGEDDWLEYEFYTPELLKKMPRISNNYSFEFENVTGPEALVFSVYFQGVTNEGAIRNYLKKERYELQKTCNIEAECWRSYENNNVITIAKFPSSKEVFVDLYRSPYNEPLTKSKINLKYGE